MKSVLEAMTELVSRGYPKDTAYRIANGELPMDRGSRMERARQQGAQDSEKQGVHRLVEPVPEPGIRQLLTGGEQQRRHDQGPEQRRQVVAHPPAVPYPLCRERHEPPV